MAMQNPLLLQHIQIVFWPIFICLPDNAYLRRVLPQSMVGIIVPIAKKTVFSPLDAMASPGEWRRLYG